MEHKCPEPGCGVDVTRAVEEALREKRRGIEMVTASTPGDRSNQVLIPCPNGHWYWYP